MPQTYHRKSRSNARRKSTEPRVPAWVWLFTGCVLGAFIMFLMRLSELDPVQRVAEKSTEAEAQPSSTQKPAKKTTSEKPRFDFYEILRDTKVTVPDFKELKKNERDKPPAQPQEYILQVASFKNAADAEQLKVELILLNMQASIETVRIRNGETWHRVLVGPFSSRSLMDRARATLVENRYESLVLKRPAHDKG